MTNQCRRLCICLLIITISNDAYCRLFKVPKSIRDKYAYLYKLPVQTTPDGGRALGSARLFKRKGINVLYLHGDRFEMAYQHGKLLKEEIKDGALPVVADLLRYSIENTLGEIPGVSEILVDYYYHSITRKLLDYGMKNNAMASGAQHPLMEGYGLSEGSGLPVKQIVYAALVPESLLVLLGQTLRGGNPFSNPFGGGECSSFVTWGNRTRNGEMLIGRNTDYPLNSRFDKYPTVIYYDPTDAQKYVSISSAGIHNAGVLGMNESGIYIDSHVIPTEDVSAEAYPIFMVSQQVLRTARTLDEAIGGFLPYRPAGGWTYVIVSMREKKAATVELSHSHAEVRTVQGDELIQTNHYLTPKMIPVFSELNRATAQDTYLRYRRIEELLRSWDGSLDIKSAASILADKWDLESKKYRTVGNAVATHVTLTSVVVDPSGDRFFVANGMAPVSQSEFVELPIQLDPATFPTESFETFRNDQYKTDFPRKAAAEQLYILAKIAYEWELDLDKAMGLVKEAIALDDTSPAFYFVLGIMALRLGYYDLAGSAFQNLLVVPEEHYRLLGHYYLGRLYGVQGLAGLAKKEFETIVQLAGPEEKKLLSATLSMMEKLKKKGRIPIKLLDLPLMIQQGDMIYY
ncbi:MAG: hypothetical protein HY537_11295 [Deltaproteobacteria bacterium]|nr:hypothetical protein [Deltaproteobacteria bacterium]